MSQERQLVPDGHWFKVADEEERRGRERRYLLGYGVGTVFVLDTSASMEGEGFRQMKEVFISIIDEMSITTGEGYIQDNVAVVTFGQDVKFLQYMTNNYNGLRRCLDAVKCSGPSPLSAGIKVSTGSFNGGVGVCALGEWEVRTRIIVITDGRPTDSRVLNGVEDPKQYNEAMVKEELVSTIQDFGFLNQITFIPVGDADMQFLEIMACASASNRLVFPSDARQLGRYVRNIPIAEQLKSADLKTMDKSGFQDIVSAIYPCGHTTDEDLKHIADIIRNKDVHRPQDEIGEYGVDDISDTMASKLLPVGTRVRRGPHWHWKNQDSDGPGTVIGYMKDINEGWTFVEWDNGVKLPYRYNLPGLCEQIFDIVECDEPRVLIDGEMIAVGCRVTRGPDWEWADQDGGEGQVGAVYKLHRGGTILVRWPNGTRSNYRFGLKGKFDVQVCDPFSDEIQHSLNESFASSTMLANQFENDLCAKCEDNDNSLDKSEKTNIPWPKHQTSEYRNNIQNECHTDDNIKRPSVIPSSLSTSKAEKSSTEETSMIKAKKKVKFYDDEEKVEDNHYESENNIISMIDSEVKNRNLERVSCKTTDDCIWQWQNTSGKWSTYSDDINDIINENYNNSPTGTISISNNNQRSSKR